MRVEQRKIKDNTISLKDNEKIEDDPGRCANILNNFFSSVFTVGPSDSYHIDDNPGLSETMRDIIIDELKVRTKIMKLNTQKSVGPDGISEILLQKAVDVFVPILTKLFVKSYDDGSIPKLMKAANIVPIFKCGDKRGPNNYRPVSITSAISKI